MLIGKRFKLEISTLAASEMNGNGKLVLVTIPAGDIVKVVSGPRSGVKLVDVLWECRTVAMFVADLEQRATEMSQESVAAKGAGE